MCGQPVCQANEQQTTWRLSHLVNFSFVKIRLNGLYIFVKKIKNKKEEEKKGKKRNKRRKTWETEAAYRKEYVKESKPDRDSTDFASNHSTSICEHHVSILGKHSAVCLELFKILTLTSMTSAL